METLPTLPTLPSFEDTLGYLKPKGFGAWLKSVFIPNRLRYRGAGHDLSIGSECIRDFEERENCHPPEAVYLISASQQPASNIVSTRVVNEDLVAEWTGELSHSWWLHHANSSTASVDEFARRVALSGVTPEFVRGLENLFEVAKTTGLTVADAGVLKLCLDAPRSVVSARAISRLPKTSNLNYVKPHSQRESYIETAVASAGALSVMAEEASVHNALIVPESLLLGFSISFLSGSEVFTDTRDPVAAGDLNTAQQIAIGVSLVETVLLTGALFASMASVLGRSISSHSEYAACRYLSTPAWVRFLDFLLTAPSVFIATPLASVAKYYGNREPPEWFFWLCLGLYGAMLGIVVPVMIAVILRGTTAYNIHAKNKPGRRWFTWLGSQETMSRLLMATGAYNKRQRAEEWQASVRDITAEKAFGDE